MENQLTENASLLIFIVHNPYCSDYQQLNQQIFTEMIYLLNLFMYDSKCDLV